MRKYVSEFLGTFLLVFIGTSSVVIARGSVLTIALAFGLAVTISAYAFGGISGGHFNPAVTTAMWLNKRIGLADAIGYIVSQIIAACLASWLVQLFAKGLGQAANQLGQTDFPKISVGLAFTVETLATFLFLTIILNVTSKEHGNSDFAGLIIGLALALMIVFSLNLTGGSLNPARSIGPALFAGGSALSHLWLYVVAPEVGAIIAAYVSKFLLQSED
ncbi:MIP/aquaporin family protein [Oenococcus kitaharae]|uniref:Aquaporin Z n=1 Tax=Oenococcus kitaharae DSM 17330 TaxID=1045004 RepID=G9WHW4_9LACO|nr:aquaporin [Oenococcus kitaharae]EHN58849.1 Aquaporin Z [Oenococcus kitaharae DSM 17330]OEY81818.1 porin [Oenococcus kitaharae]OEY84049.1 porin [Oenococcus kitaharae]OEY85593.1 porin [Oenococcus kitaharae]